MITTPCSFKRIFLILVSKTKGALKCTLVTSFKEKIIKKQNSNVEPVCHQNDNEWIFVKPFSLLIVNF